MDFRDIGKHLPRTKWGEGWVEKRGKRRKVWVGFWYEYDPAGDGERRRTREKVLGTVKEIGDRRPSAMARLREVRTELDQRSLNIYTMMVSSILYFQRNTTGAALISSKYW
jgi:hypothetical protein